MPLKLEQAAKTHLARAPFLAAHKRIGLTPSACYLLALLLAYAAMILASPHAPLLEDYPTWVYEGVAVAHALKGHLDPQFTLKHFPVPNVLSDLGLGALCMIMDWRWAAKAWLCVYVFISFFACYRFAHSLPKPSPYAYWLAPTIVVFNLCFWWGFINFQFSLALLLLFCSALLQAKPRRMVLGSLLLLVFLCHAISFAVCGLALVLHSLYHKRYRLLPSAGPSVFFAAWYVYGRFVSIGNPERLVLKDIPVPYMSRMFLAYKVNSFLKSVGYVNPRLHGHPIASALLSSPGMWVLIAITVTLGCVLLYMLMTSARACFREKSPERFLWATFALVFMAALLCPSEGLGVSDPGSRFMVCALTLGIFLLRNGKLGVLASASSVTLGLAGAAMFVTLSFRPSAADIASAHVPSAVSNFAHVEPASRAYYYQALTKGVFQEPVFGTSWLFNTHARPATVKASR